MSQFTKKKIIPILMCGGSGSRLWPMSRESLPKQFLKCNPLSPYSFLQDTFLRLKNIKDLGDPILIANEKHRFVVAEQMREINVNPKEIILEPFGRNTAPAIALGAIRTELIDKDSICLIVPTDHSIKDIEKFIEIINQGINFSEKNFVNI